MRRLGLGFLLVLALAAVSGAARAPAAERPAMPVAAPVASLDPAATDRLWQKVRRDKHGARGPHRADGVSPTPGRLLLGDRLPAPCDEACGDRVHRAPVLLHLGPPARGRRGQATTRALRTSSARSDQLHAMAEFHFTTWSKWVASTGSSWYVAGTTARRMAAAGYNFSKGDTWVLNEISSACRTNTGQAVRTCASSCAACTRETARVPRAAQSSSPAWASRRTSLGQYQTNLQNWLSDSRVLGGHVTCVSDWSQEVYGDVRNWRYQGRTRRPGATALNDYLQHALVLADAGHDDRARREHSSTRPSARSRTRRGSATRHTAGRAVPAAQMADVRLRARLYLAAVLQLRDGAGRRPLGLRLGSAERIGLHSGRLRGANRSDPDAPRGGDPRLGPGRPGGSGSAACVVRGTNVCVGDLDGARLNAAWQTFRAWTQPLLSFATPPQTIQAGSTTAAMRLTLLSNAGQPQTALAPLAVTLSSTSPAGRFSTTPTGPWTPTLALTIAAGSGTSPDFYYLDTRAGPQLLTAAATGVTSGAQTVTVLPGAALSLAVTPKSARLRTRSTLSFTAIGKDTYGNAVPVSAALVGVPSTYGTVSPRTGPTTTLTTLRATGQASVTATAGFPAVRSSASIRHRAHPGDHVSPALEGGAPHRTCGGHGGAAGHERRPSRWSSGSGRGDLHRSCDDRSCGKATLRVPVARRAA